MAAETVPRRFHSPLYHCLQGGVWVLFGSGGQKTREIPGKMQLFSGWQLHSRRGHMVSDAIRHTYLAFAECRCMPQILQNFGCGKLTKLSKSHRQILCLHLESIYDFWPWIRPCCTTSSNACPRICCCCHLDCFAKNIMHKQHVGFPYPISLPHPYLYTQVHL